MKYDDDGTQAEDFCLDRARLSMYLHSGAFYQWHFSLRSESLKVPKQSIILCADSMIAEVQKKITDAFDIFDHEANKTVDVRYVALSFFCAFWKMQCEYMQ